MYLAAVLFAFHESDGRMSDSSYSGPQATRLPDLAVLAIGGPDASAFLQGQLSANLDDLSQEHVLLACCNSAQGRVQAVIWLAQRDDGLALILPASMLERLTDRLRKYVLRAKVKMDGGAVTVGVVDGMEENRLVSERAHVQRGPISVVHLPGHTQQLVIAPLASIGAEDAAASLRWRREHVAAGLPQVHPTTYEEYVAQMLNLDVLGGISFNKGCYTGQEIIARAHYRGAVKRRMFRFTAACAPPTAGSRVLAGDQPAGDVVDSVDAGNGCELLAVVGLSHIESGAALTLQSGDSLTRLPLPYQV